MLVIAHARYVWTVWSVYKRNVIGPCNQIMFLCSNVWNDSELRINFFIHFVSQVDWWETSLRHSWCSFFKELARLWHIPGFLAPSNILVLCSYLYTHSQSEGKWIDKHWRPLVFTNHFEFTLKHETRTWKHMQNITFTTGSFSFSSCSQETKKW